MPSFKAEESYNDELDEHAQIASACMIGSGILRIDGKVIGPRIKISLQGSKQIAYIMEPDEAKALGQNLIDAADRAIALLSGDQ